MFFSGVAPPCELYKEYVNIEWAAAGNAGLVAGWWRACGGLVAGWWRAGAGLVAAGWWRRAGGGLVAGWWRAGGEPYVCFRARSSAPHQKGGRVARQ